MPTFKTVTDLEKFLKAEISKTLKKDVFEQVKKVEQENIQDAVYDAYKPKVYKRRMYEDGLIADSNIIPVVIDNETIAVVNVAEPNPYTPQGRASVDKNLPELVEYGHDNGHGSYDYSNGGAYLKPRPFTANTIDELRETNSHVKAMKDGLNRKGIKTI